MGDFDFIQPIEGIPKVVTRLDQSKFVVHKIYNYEYTIGEQQEKYVIL